MKKPISPKVHGIIDYAFSGLQFVLPAFLQVNPKANRIFQLLGAGFLFVDAFTNTPVGIKRAIPFKTHEKLDMAFLTGLAVLTITNFIRKDRKALSYYLGFMGLATAHYLLTDYKSS